MELVSRTPTCRQRRAYVHGAPVQHLNLQEEATQSENDAVPSLMTVIWAAVITELTSILFLLLRDTLALPPPLESPKIWLKWLT